MATARKARIAVVGTGWWATYTHIPSLLARPDAELVALANRGVEKLRLAAEVFQIARTYTDFRELLDRETPDGVVVCTAQPAHYQVAKAALAFWITGLRPEQVSAYMSQVDTAVDVVDAVSVRLSNGAVGVLGSSGNLRPGDPGQHQLSVYCSGGYLVLDLIGGTLVVRKHSGAVESPAPLPLESRYPRSAPVNNLVDVIRGTAENLSPGEVGWVTVNFLDAAYRSAASAGSPVAVENCVERPEWRTLY